VADWGVRQAPDLLGLTTTQIHAFNDDRLGRCLDRLFDSDCGSVALRVAGAAIRVVGNRRLWALSQFVMAAGVAAPVLWPSMGGIMVAALLVGGTFMVSTMGGMQEAQIVAGPHATRLMAAMTAAFAAGQIAGPLLVATGVGPHGDFSRPLSIACLLLLVSAGALARRVGPGPGSGR